MRVLALVPSEKDVSPGQRYRIEQWEPLLREKGVEITYAHFTFPAMTRVLYKPGHVIAKTAFMAAAYFRQLMSVLKAHHYDLVYIFREATLIGPALIETLVSWQGVPIVYDFDDAIFIPYKSPSNSYLSYLKCFGKTAGICRRARQVMVGNEYLRDYALQHNKDVTIIPTTVDTDWYRPEARRSRHDGIPVIGWTGSYSSHQYLERVFPALKRVAERHPFHMVVVGTEKPDIPGVDVEFRPWRSETEVEDLADVDIGIMPIPDDPWSRGKCGLKALLYMALAAPPVVSPVGVNSDIVCHGENGFHARSEDDWVELLHRLLTDRSLRDRMGRRARRKVEERYSARAVVPRVHRIFGKAVSEGASAVEAPIRNSLQ